MNSQSRKARIQEIENAMQEFETNMRELRACEVEINNPATTLTAQYSDMPRGGSGSKDAYDKFGRAINNAGYYEVRAKELRRLTNIVQTIAYREPLISDYIDSGLSYRQFAKVAGMSRWKLTKIIRNAIEREIDMKADFEREHGIYIK